MSVRYRISTNYDGNETPVGILPVEEVSAGPDYGRIPIKVGDDAVSKWHSTPEQIAPGPTHLAAFPLPYTTEVEGKVYATDDKTEDKEWFLHLAIEKDTYAINIDQAGTGVWTVVNGEIKIEPFMPGNLRQVFRIVLI